MAAITDVDVNQKIVYLMEQELYRNGCPTPYFEELWNQLKAAILDLETRVSALEGP